MARNRRSNGTKKNASKAKLWRQIFAWAIPLGLLAIPLYWWLEHVPARRLILFAACREIELVTPHKVDLRASKIEAIDAHGIWARLENPGEADILDTKANQIVSNTKNEIILADGRDGNSPALSVAVSEPSGQFFLTSTGNTILAQSTNPKGAVVLRATMLSARMDADGFSIVSNRVRLNDGSSGDFKIVTKNPDMTHLWLRSADGRESSLEFQLPSKYSLSVSLVEQSAIDSQLSQCSNKLTMALEGEELKPPTMPLLDLQIKWIDLRVKDFSIQQASEALSLQASGLASSIVYDNREMNRSNFDELSSESIAKKGILGLALLASLWIGKQLADRLSKLVLDRIFSE